MNYSDFIQTCIALVGILGVVIAGFYGIKQKTTIITLKESNEAYVERNDQLEKERIELKQEWAEKFAELNGRIKTLERIKTPPLRPLIEMVQQNHVEVMSTLRGKTDVRPINRRHVK